MKEEKYIDPRLQARENLFQQLHLSSYETMGYARAIQDHVEQTGYDIEPSNLDYLQLLRDYEVTKNLAPIIGSQLEPLCEYTDEVLKQRSQAFANRAQLCAAAISTLNLWRILSEIPTDLRDNDMVTKELKDRFHRNMRTWDYIVNDLCEPEDSF